MYYSADVEDIEFQARERELEALLVDSEEFRILEGEFGAFCPFEAMGVVSAEIRHNAFLAYLLDPNKPHGFGDQILRSFLITVAKVSRSAGKVISVFRPIDAHLLDLDEAEIRFQWKSIDLVIVLNSSKIVVVVEMKIESSQSDAQLLRYREITEDKWGEGWGKIFVFLTKYDEIPNDVDAWVQLKYLDIVAGIEGSALTSSNDSMSMQMLKSYLKMMRRNHMPDDKLEILARQIWAKHGSALEFLANRRPDGLGDVMAILNKNRDKIAKNVSDSRIKIIADICQQANLRFAIQNWDDLRGFKTSRYTKSERLILAEIKREGARVVFNLYLGPGTTDDRARYAELLKKERLHKPTGQVGPEWMCLEKEIAFEQKEFERKQEFEIISDVEGKFSKFLNKCFDHFDPIIRCFK
jgi:hypothetical protein